MKAAPDFGKQILPRLLSLWAALARPWLDPAKVGKWKSGMPHSAFLAASNSHARGIGRSLGWERRHPCRSVRAEATRRQGCRHYRDCAIWLAVFNVTMLLFRGPRQISGSKWMALI